MVQNIDELTYSLVKKALDASAERGRVIANNIANANTPGFKASDVVFEDKVNDILNNQSLGLTVTHANHISDGNTLSTLQPEVVQDNSTSMRVDGNNVDIDSQMSNLAANTIMYNTLISQANSRLAMMKYVIDNTK